MDLDISNSLHWRSENYSITLMPLGMQDGSDTVCHGVDALNTETGEVTMESSLSVFFKILLGIRLENKVKPFHFFFPGGSIYFKGDSASIWWGWAYI